MVIKADENFPQNKGNAHLRQHPQADAMEFQIIRESAEQLDQGEDGQNIDKVARHAVDQPMGKRVGQDPSAHRMDAGHDVNHQPQNGSKQSGQHDEDQDGDDVVQNPPIYRQGIDFRQRVTLPVQSIADRCRDAGALTPSSGTRSAAAQAMSLVQSAHYRLAGRSTRRRIGRHRCARMSAYAPTVRDESAKSQC